MTLPKNTWRRSMPVICVRPIDILVGGPSKAAADLAAVHWETKRKSRHD